MPTLKGRDGNLYKGDLSKSFAANVSHDPDFDPGAVLKGAAIGGAVAPQPPPDRKEVTPNVTNRKLYKPRRGTNSSGAELLARSQRKLSDSPPREELSAPHKHKSQGSRKRLPTAFQVQSEKKDLMRLRPDSAKR